MRTFKRLQNLVALCVLAYAGLAHFLPACPEASIRLAKAMKENFAAINLPCRTFVANLRILLGMTAIRFISGYPPKRAPPCLTSLLSSPASLLEPPVCLPCGRNTPNGLPLSKIRDKRVLSRPFPSVRVLPSSPRAAPSKDREIEWNH